MPNTTTASAEPAFRRVPLGGCEGGQSARSAGEYGGGGFAPANGVPRCPGSPCTGAASRYRAER